MADGRPFILGTAFSLTDAACYHPVWFLRNFPPAAAVFDEFPRLVDWAERITAMGHGRRRDMSPEDALRIARESTPATAAASPDAHEPNGVTAGDRVTVTPDDYGFDPVAGQVVASSIHEIAIRRRDDQVGDLVIHFPRIGFRVAMQ